MPGTGREMVDVGAQLALRLRGRQINVESATAQVLSGRIWGIFVSPVDYRNRELSRRN